MAGETIAHKLKLQDGSLTDLACSFGSDPGLGFYRSSAGLQFVVNGAASLLIDESGGAITGGFANGAVGAPSIYAAADTDTGIYFPAANQIAMTSGGVQSLLATATYVSAPNRLMVASDPTSVAGAGVIVSNWSANADTSQRGINLSWTANSSATGSARGIQISLATAAAAFTCPQALAINVGGISAGAGSTITRAVSFFSSTQTAGGTGNATLADNVAFTGNYFIHSTNTNPSVLTGYLMVQNQADPGAVTDGIRIGSVDLSAGNATLSLRTETAVATDAAVASTHSLSVQLNGATYKILLSNV